MQHDGCIVSARRQISGCRRKIQAHSPEAVLFGKAEKHLVVIARSTAASDNQQRASAKAAAPERFYILGSAAQPRFGVCVARSDRLRLHSTAPAASTAHY